MLRIYVSVSDILNELFLSLLQSLQGYYGTAASAFIIT